MATAVVTSKQTGSAATATLAITKPAAGHLLVAFVSQLATAAAPAQAGWTVATVMHSVWEVSANSMYVLFKEAAGTETEVAPTAGAGGSINGICYFEVSGAAIVQPEFAGLKNNMAAGKSGGVLLKTTTGGVVLACAAMAVSSGEEMAWTKEGAGAAGILTNVSTEASRMVGGFKAALEASALESTVIAHWTKSNTACVMAMEFPEAVSGGVTIPLAAASSVSSSTLAVAAGPALPLVAAGSVSAAALALTAAPAVPLVAASSVSAASLGLTAGPFLPLVAAGSVSAAALGLTAGPTIPLSAAQSASSASLALSAAVSLALGAAVSVSSASLVVTTPGAVLLALAPATAASSTSLALRAPVLLGLSPASSTSATSFQFTAPHVGGEVFSAGGFPSGISAGGAAAGRGGQGGSSSAGMAGGGGSSRAGSAGAGGTVQRMFSSGGGSS